MVGKILIGVGVLLLVGIFFMPQLTWMSAKKAFEKENISKPWAPETAYKAGKINMRFMRHKNALAIFRKTMETWPDASFRGDCLYQIALCYEKTGQSESAIAGYETFLKAAPGHRWSDQAKKRIEDVKAKMM